MSGETEREISGWTVDQLMVHQNALRAADLRFGEERDRRYTEVAIEREKALQIANEARKDALQLARDIQIYKDEKANELRSQIESERGSYATKDDLAAAIREVVAGLTQSGIERRAGLSESARLALQAAAVVVATVAVIVTILIANGTFG